MSSGVNALALVYLEDGVKPAYNSIKGKDMTEQQAVIVTKILGQCTFSLDSDEAKKENCLFLDRCFEPSQPLWIISGLKETFIERHTVEKTNKARGQSEKTESCRENLWNEI